MKTGYKRSMGHNYLLLQNDENYSNSADSYQMRTFLENQITGLLPCEIQKVNGEEVFYYDITGCQNIVHLFEKDKFKKQDLEKLFLSVAQTTEVLEEYLLERNKMLFSPTYVYQNMESGNYQFIWFVYSQKTFETEFRSLTEYLLPKIDHEDKAAVAVGYGVYRISMEEYMDIKGMRQQIFLEHETVQGKKTEQKTYEYEEKSGNEEERQKILDEFYEEESEETTSWRMILSIASVILFLASLYLFRRNWYVLLAEGIFLLIVALGAGIWYLGYHRKKKRANTIKKVSKITEDITQDEFYEECHEEWSEKEEQKKINSTENMTVILDNRAGSGAYLRCLDDAAEKIYLIEKETLLIGMRREAVDIWLNFPTVSRLHAKIIHREDGDYLVDLNSRNGTLLNGEYLNPEEEYCLENKSMISFAQVRFVYIK